MRQRPRRADQIDHPPKAPGDGQTEQLSTGIERGREFQRQQFTGRAHDGPAGGGDLTLVSHPTQFEQAVVVRDHVDVTGPADRARRWCRQLGNRLGQKVRDTRHLVNLSTGQVRKNIDEPLGIAKDLVIP